MEHEHVPQGPGVPSDRRIGVVRTPHHELIRRTPVSAYRWGGGIGIAFGVLVASFGFWGALGVLAWGTGGLAAVLIGRIIRQRLDERRPPGDL